jgi:hypothetical protein
MHPSPQRMERNLNHILAEQRPILLMAKGILVREVASN